MPKADPFRDTRAKAEKAGLVPFAPEQDAREPILDANSPAVARVLSRIMREAGLPDDEAERRLRALQGRGG